MDIGTNPNDRLQRYLVEGTTELRNFVASNIISDNPREIDRITKYYLYWKYYEGHHYKEFNDAMLSFNYVKAFIDKVNLFLLGDTGFTFTVTSYSNDVVEKELEQNAEKLMLYNWRRNKLMLFSQELLQMGGICGDAWVGLSWEDRSKYVKLTLFDRRDCIPELENGDIAKLSGFTVRMTLEKNKEQMKVYCYRFTAQSIETWKQKTAAADLPDTEKFGYTKDKNPLGFIPVVHFKNRPQSSGYFGKSDANDIMKLNKIYNEIHQEIKSVIDYHSTPTTIVTGATVKNLKRGIGQIWSGLPPEANVFNLGLDVDLTAATNFGATIKTAMHEISDVPEGVLGKLQAISGTSAAALKLTYLPLIQQANLKALTYGEGIIEINEMILDFYKTYDKKNKFYAPLPEDFRLDFRCEPVFAYGFPTDRMNILQEGQMEISMGIGSKKELANKLGKNNVDDLFEQIMQEKLEDAALLAQTNELSGYGMGADSEEVPASEETKPPVNPAKKSAAPIKNPDNLKEKADAKKD